VATGVGHNRERVDAPTDAGVRSAGECPFCHRIRLRDELAAESDLCVAFYDTTPLTPGHVLIIPKRHEPDFLALSPEECGAIWRMAQEIRARTDQQLHPDGFNLGANVGTAGGQTIDHAHLHLIPRYVGDVPEPKGGIRWLIPERARYWVDDVPGARR
jgi:ATP adenylyltransferase